MTRSLEFVSGRGGQFGLSSAADDKAIALALAVASTSNDREVVELCTEGERRSARVLRTAEVGQQSRTRARQLCAVMGLGVGCADNGCAVGVGQTQIHRAGVIDTAQGSALVKLNYNK